MPELVFAHFALYTRCLQYIFNCNGPLKGSVYFTAVFETIFDWCKKHIYFDFLSNTFMYAVDYRNIICNCAQKFRQPTQKTKSF